MRAAWLEAKLSATGEYRAKKNTVSMNIRNAYYFNDIFDCDMIFDVDSINRHSSEKYDVVFIGYSTRYSAYKQEAEFLKKQNAVIVYVSTEYGNQLPGCLYYSDRPFFLLANYENTPRKMQSKSWRKMQAHHFVNLNVLTYDDKIRSQKKAYDLLYYGQFREDRCGYLRSLNNMNIRFSTHKKNVWKWCRSGVMGYHWVDPIDWSEGHETLALYRRSIYFEDVYTHTNYNCLANRFYEAIKCDVMPMIHTSCANTVERSGYDIPDMMVWETASDLRQRKKYARGYVRGLRERARTEKEDSQQMIKTIIESL